MKKPMLLVAMLTAAAEEQLANARAGQSRVEELQATKRAMLEAYAQSMSYDGVYWLSSYSGLR